VQGVIKTASNYQRHPSNESWQPEPEDFILTTTIEDKQYLLRGDFRVDVGDYKSRIVGKQQDRFELLLPNGKIRKYKIVRVGPIPDYSYTPPPETTIPAPANTAASPVPPTVQSDHLDALTRLAWLSGEDKYHVRINNACFQAVNIW